MAASRRLPQYIANLKHGAWQQSGFKAASMPSNFGLGTVLRGRTLGIWGYGRIGQIVAGYAKAFGMGVKVWGRETSRAKALTDGYQVAHSREDFLHLRHSVRAPQAHARHAALHHLARPVADEAHGPVRQHLAGRAGGARRTGHGLAARPPRHGRSGCVRVRAHPARPRAAALENCICTPHIGYVEQDNYELYFGAAFDNVVNFVQGKPTNIVNPEVLGPR
jgi:D-3-phosphoglycerate dehydrogenase